MVKPHLVILYYPFYMLVYSIFKYSVKNFALSSCSIFLLRYFPPVNPLMGFCISVMIDNKMSFESFLSFSIFQKYVYYVFFNCLIKFTSELIWNWVFLIRNSQITSLIFFDRYRFIQIFYFYLSILVNCVYVVEVICIKLLIISSPQILPNINCCRLYSDITY